MSYGQIAFSYCRKGTEKGRGVVQGARIGCGEKRQAKTGSGSKKEQERKGQEAGDSKIRNSSPFSLFALLVLISFFVPTA
jgi:hypothetical protein